MRNYICEHVFENYAVEKNFSPGTLKVHKSTIKSVMLDANKTFDSAIGPELIDPAVLNLYFEKAEKRYGAKSFYAIKNKILAFRDYYIKTTFDAQVSDGSFSAALQFLIKQEKISVSELAQKLEIPGATFNRWVLGECTPDYNNLSLVPEIENYFKLPTGSLTMRLGPCVFGQKQEIIKNKKQTEYGKKMGELNQKPYRFKYELWPLEIKKDIEFIRKIYSSDKSTVDSVVKASAQRWQKSKSGVQNSYERLKVTYERIFGFMLLPKEEEDPQLRGLGLSVNELTITVLFDPIIVSAFMDFYAIRQGVKNEDGILEEKYSNELKQDLKSAKALLNPAQGFIPQMPHLASQCFEIDFAGNIKKVFSPDDPQLKEKWSQYCLKSYQGICRLFTGTRFVQTRNPQEALGEMVNSQNIFADIKTYIKKMEMASMAPGIPAFRKAVLYRDFLVNLFHIIFALRSDHYSFMKIGRHFQKDKNGNWRLFLYKKDFKIGDNDSTEYSILDLPSDVSRYIETYIKIHRPILRNPETDFFFLPSKNSNHKHDHGDYLEPRSISRLVNQGTLIFSNSETGFGSHGCRNLTGSACFQKELAAYELGAGVLGHSVETNKRHYVFNVQVNKLRALISILQKEGVLETPKEILVAQKKERDEIQEMKEENKNLKEMLQRALSLTQKDH